jgi:hypothetical protein
MSPGPSAKTVKMLKTLRESRWSEILAVLAHLAEVPGATKPRADFGNGRRCANDTRRIRGSDDEGKAQFRQYGRQPRAKEAGREAFSNKGPSDTPPGSLPRGLCREQAAEYVGVSATKFDQMVADRRMPAPKRIDGRVVWDRLQLDIAFAALPDENGRDDVWSKVALRRGRET